jgi:ketosteroid isomerase-like protein
VLVAADVVITQFPEQIDAGEYHGHEGFREVMADWTGSWDDWSIEIVDAREVGDLVLATARQRGRGRGSGAPMEAESSFVFTLDQGSITRWQMFSSEEQALKAIAGALGDLTERRARPVTNARRETAAGGQGRATAGSSIGTPRMAALPLVFRIQAAYTTTASATVSSVEPSARSAPAGYWPSYVRGAHDP